MTNGSLLNHLFNPLGDPNFLTAAIAERFDFLLVMLSVVELFMSGGSALSLSPNMVQLLANDFFSNPRLVV